MHVCLLKDTLSNCSKPHRSLQSSLDFAWLVLWLPLLLLPWLLLLSWLLLLLPPRLQAYCATVDGFLHLLTFPPNNRSLVPSEPAPNTVHLTQYNFAPSTLTPTHTFSMLVASNARRNASRNPASVSCTQPIQSVCQPTQTQCNFASTHSPCHHHLGLALWLHWYRVYPLLSPKEPARTQPIRSVFQPTQTQYNFASSTLTVPSPSHIWNFGPSGISLMVTFRRTSPLVFTTPFAVSWCGFEEIMVRGLRRSWCGVWRGSW
jgi:hypothetical protein